MFVLVGCGSEEEVPLEDKPFEELTLDDMRLMREQGIPIPELDNKTEEEDTEDGLSTDKDKAIQERYHQVVYVYDVDNAEEFEANDTDRQEVGQTTYKVNEQEQKRRDELAAKYNLDKYEYQAEVTTEGVLVDELLTNSYYRYDDYTLLMELEATPKQIETRSKTIQPQHITIDAETNELVVNYTLKNKGEWVVNPTEFLNVYNQNKAIAPINNNQQMVEAGQTSQVELRYSLNNLEDVSKIRVHFIVPTAQVINFPYTLDELTVYQTNTSQ